MSMLDHAKCEIQFLPADGDGDDMIELMGEQIMLDHAKRELEFLHDGDEMNELMREQILEMVKLFASHGHSGCSAPYAISLITPLLKQEPIGPLLGTDNEWCEVAEGQFQNKRCSSVFKYNGQAYDIDGKIFREKNGCCYSTGESKVAIEFPYTPTTIYVDV